MKALICDDDLAALDHYAALIRREFQIQGMSLDLEVYNDSAQVVRRLGESHQYDLYFLDVDMPQYNGIQVGQALRSTSSKPYIIFLSSYDSYVFESFQVQPFRFLRKRFLERDLKEAVTALKKDLEMSPDRITIRSGKRVFHFDPWKLVYLESDNKNVRFVVKDWTGSKSPADGEEDEGIVIRTTMNEMEQCLGGSGFIRVHKGYLVNHRFIYQLLRKEVELSDGRRLPVGKRYYEDALDVLRRISI